MGPPKVTTHTGKDSGLEWGPIRLMNPSKNTKSSPTQAGERKKLLRQKVVCPTSGNRGPTSKSAAKPASTTSVPSTVTSLPSTSAAAKKIQRNSTDAKTLNNRSETSVPCTKLSSGTDLPKGGNAHISASTRAYRTRRSAARIVSRLGAKDPALLSEEERGRLTWARAHVGVRPSASPVKPVAAVKRQRSDEHTARASLQSSKRPKTLPPKPRPSKPLSEVVKESLTWAVIDHGHPEGTITPAKWKLVEMALLKVFLDVIASNPGPSPSCRDAGWFQGHIKVIACADFRSMELYKLAISKVGEVWPGAKLEATPLDKIPQRPRSRARIPAEPSNPEEILQILKYSNTDLPTDNWRVAKVGEARGNSRDAIIILNEKSLQLINAREGVINYGFGAITLNVYKADAQMARLPPAGLPTPQVQPSSSRVTASDEDVGSQSSQSSKLSYVSNSELVGDMFNGLDINAGVVSPLSEEDDANATLVVPNDEGHPDKST